MGAEVTILANSYTYNFLKGLTHSALRRGLKARRSRMVRWPSGGMRERGAWHCFRWKLFCFPSICFFPTISDKKPADRSELDDQFKGE